jgi:hypothetical protein
MVNIYHSWRTIKLSPAVFCKELPVFWPFFGKRRFKMGYFDPSSQSGGVGRPLPWGVTI